MTALGQLAFEITDGVKDYASDHRGAPPKSWDDLRPYVDLDELERRFKVFIQSKMILLGDVNPTLAGTDPVKIVAMTAFAISDDRQEGIGRYAVVQKRDGTFTFRWANEDAVLKACATANITLLPAAVFHERPQRVHDLGYRIKLMEDAVKHGVSVEEAGKVVDRHISALSEWRARYATTWAEIAVSNLSDVPNEAAIPVPVAQSASEPRAYDSSVWLWVGSGFALVAAVAMFWSRSRAAQ